MNLRLAAIKIYFQKISTPNHILSLDRLILIPFPTASTLTHLPVDTKAGVIIHRNPQ